MHGGVAAAECDVGLGRVHRIARCVDESPQPLRTDRIVCIDDQNPYFRMIRGSWGLKLREVFEALEDPQWGGGETSVPLCVASPRYEPMRKITHPGEKIV